MTAIGDRQLLGPDVLAEGLNAWYDKYAPRKPKYLLYLLVALCLMSLFSAVGVGIGILILAGRYCLHRRAKAQAFKRFEKDHPNSADYVYISVM